MRTLFALALVAVLGGCDLLGGGETVVTGTVRLKETGQPLPGIAVSLHDSGGWGSYPLVAYATTDRDGEYRIETQKRGNDGFLMLFANDEPNYNKCYSGGYMSEGAKNGKHTRKDLVLFWSGNCPNP